MLSRTREVSAAVTSCVTTQTTSPLSDSVTASINSRIFVPNRTRAFYRRDLLGLHTELIDAHRGGGFDLHTGRDGNDRGRRARQSRVPAPHDEHAGVGNVE